MQYLHGICLVEAPCSPCSRVVASHCFIPFPIFPVWRTAVDNNNGHLSNGLPIDVHFIQTLNTGFGIKWWKDKKDLLVPELVFSWEKQILHKFLSDDSLQFVMFKLRYSNLTERAHSRKQRTLSILTLPRKHNKQLSAMLMGAAASQFLVLQTRSANNPAPKTCH